MKETSAPKNISRHLIPSPFFSICIPQYNRTSFLLRTLLSIADQKFKDFEVCISDDCSTDGREQEISDFLEKSRFDYVYSRQTVNRRYDANLRSSIELAQGKFCFLLGNDDALASPNTLANIHRLLESSDTAVAITNFKHDSTGQTVRRVTSGVFDAGAETALAHFRNFSFVSGVILRREPAQALSTTRWDGSEMYQMYLGCRMIAEGGKLLEIGEAEIREGVRIPGEKVDIYSASPRLKPCPIRVRHLTLGRIGPLVIDATQAGNSRLSRSATIWRVYSQLYFFTYPFWIIEYRRVQSWKYAMGICLGLSPKYTTQGVQTGLLMRILLTFVYCGTALVGLFIPNTVFQKLLGPLYRLAKSWGLKKS